MCQTHKYTQLNLPVELWAKETWQGPFQGLYKGYEAQETGERGREAQSPGEKGLSGGKSLLQEDEHS